MADFSVNSPRPRHIRPGRMEYGLYFGLIYLLALPFALVACIWRLARDGQLPEAGPLKRARAEAQVIVPMLFRG